jgi:hypothetical protein
MALKFTDNSAAVKGALNDAVIAYLHEASGELEAQVKRNTKVGTGQLKNSWTYKVDESKGESTIGSPLENAIWEEFGTGEYALHGDGRKGGWYYKDEKDGTWHHTYGKNPHRAFQRAFNSLKPALKRRAEQVLKGKMQ